MIFWLCISLLSFFTPQVLAQVNVFPEGEFVSYPGGMATFYCISLSVVPSDPLIGVQWLGNDTLLTEQENIEMEFSGIGTLKFTNLTLANNNTNIRCRGIHMSRKTTTSNDARLLVLQGRLTAVNDLALTIEDSMFSLTWEPPFTRDIENIDPDISGYCVDVVKSTSSLHSECGINVTRFSYMFPAAFRRWCELYIFTVTAVNVVGYGTRNTVSSLANVTIPRLTEVTVLMDLYSLTMSAPVCCGSLIFLDTITGENLRMDCTDLTITYNIIAFNATLLTANRHYNVTVRANNSAGFVTSHTTISTHAVMTATLRETQENVIKISVHYFPGSGISGALFKLVFITDSGDVDFSKSVLLPLDRDTSHNYTLPFNLSPGQYRVFIHDIEQDGTLSSGVGYPAVTDELVASGNNQGSNLESPSFYHLENCHVNHSVFLILAECTYPSVSMATGFQMIVQSGVLDQVGKLYVNQTRDGQTSASVEVEESGLYLVSIIPIVEGTGITGSDVEYAGFELLDDTSTTSVINSPAGSDSSERVIIIVVALTVAIIVLMALVMIVAVLMKQRKSSEFKCTSPNMYYAKNGENETCRIALEDTEHQQATDDCSPKERGFVIPTTVQKKFPGQLINNGDPSPKTFKEADNKVFTTVSPQQPQQQYAESDDIAEEQSDLGFTFYDNIGRGQGSTDSGSASHVQCLEPPIRNMPNALLSVEIDDTL